MLFGVNDLQIIIFAGMNNKSVIFFTKCLPLLKRRSLNFKQAMIFIVK